NRLAEVGTRTAEGERGEGGEEAALDQAGQAGGGGLTGGESAIAAVDSAHFGWADGEIGGLKLGPALAIEGKRAQGAVVDEQLHVAGGCAGGDDQHPHPRDVEVGFTGAERRDRSDVCGPLPATTA